MSHIIHQHNLIKLIKPLKFTSEKHVNDWLTYLTKYVLKMQICFPARAIYIDIPGNEGFTGQIGLVTSHMSIHTWDKDDYSQIDIYSCACYNMEEVIDYINTTLQPEKILSVEFDRQDERIYTNVS